MSFRERLSNLGWYMLLPVGLAAGIIAAATGATVWLYNASQPTECESAIRLAEDLGLSLSSDEEVLECTYRAVWQDSSGTIVVRTESTKTRTALLRRSGVTDFEADDPRHESALTSFEVGQPNGDRLSFTYDDSIAAGLRVTIRALNM